ncbi:MAG TPA: hypothetical protein EYH05_09450 [Anaerolineae bacterium]|nr:hypothetical protein [Anaerolineae bacterium]
MNLEERLSQLYRIECPPSQVLGEYHLGMLPPGEADGVALHLAHCPHCRGEVETLAAFLAAEEVTAVKSTWLKRIRTILAELVPPTGIDSPAEPALSGVRGVLDDETRLYQAEEWQVALEFLADDPAQTSLLGIVFGPPVAAWQVQWQQADERVWTTAVDETGAFEIPNIQPGEYDLILKSDEAEINILSLVI